MKGIKFIEDNDGDVEIQIFDSKDPSFEIDVLAWHKNNDLDLILSSKIELVLWIKNEPPIAYDVGLDQWNTEWYTVATAKTIWKLIQAPYNFTYEEIQGAWNKFKKAKDL